MADMDEGVWGRLIIIGKDGHERKAEMELDDPEGEPYIIGRSALALSRVFRCRAPRG